MLTNSRVQVLIIILVCFISRVPQLASPYLLLDGDECLVGIMAKHIYTGKEFPFFFWGQQYGFSLLECLMIIPFYAVLGVNAIAVKLSMLTFWTIGVVFLYKTLSLLNKGNKLIPFLLILVFISLPAWAIWAMKARGGYLTAFVLSSLALYLLFAPRLKGKIITYCFIGIIINFINQAHAFWLLGVLPMLFYQGYKELKFKGITVALITATPLIFLFNLYKKSLVRTAVSPVLIPDKSVIGAYITRIPDYLYNSLHGNYYFSFVQKPNFFCAFLAVVVTTILFILPMVALYYLFFHRKGNMLFIFSAVSVPACMLATLLSPEVHGRYFLPITGFALLPVLLLINKIKNPKPFIITSSAMIVSGLVAMITFWNFEFLKNGKETVLKSVNYLEQNNTKYVFCTDCLLTWQINFYSNETITARMPYIPERYAPNGIAVNEAFDKGEQTAILCYADQLPTLHLKKPLHINDFGIGINPSKQELAQYFQFPEASQ